MRLKIHTLYQNMRKNQNRKEKWAYYSQTFYALQKLSDLKTGYNDISLL